MGKSVKDLVAAANAVVPGITVDEAQQKIEGGALVVDVRDAAEVEQSGKVAGAVHIPRGMVEFRADPDTPYYDKSFEKDRAVVVYCASGGRAALSGRRSRRWATKRSTTSAGSTSGRKTAAP